MRIHRYSAASAGSYFGVAVALMFAASILPATAGPIATLSRTTVAFDHIPVQELSRVQPLFVTNTGDAPLTISGLTIGAASVHAEFRLAGTCTPPLTLPPNARCRVDLTAYDGNETFVVGGYANHATLSLQSDSSVAVPDVALTSYSLFDFGDFEAPQPTPAWIDFPALPPGAVSAVQTMTFADVGKLDFNLVSIGLASGNSSDFALTSTCVAGATLAAGQSCQATISFQPTANGPRATELQLKVFYSGGPALIYAFSVTGVGGTAGPAPTVTIVEYYNAALDHYFITWVAQEISDLDTGVHKGWARTGYTFKAYTTTQSGTSPVCRFYIPPGLGDSHFFGRGTTECNATGQKNPSFVLEDPQFMQMFLPVAGVCPAGTTSIYRVFSNRADANHRYMTDKTVRDGMVAKGWLAEGDGPDLVVMCAPG